MSGALLRAKKQSVTVSVSGVAAGASLGQPGGSADAQVEATGVAAQATVGTALLGVPVLTAATLLRTAFLFVPGKNGNGRHFSLVVHEEPEQIVVELTASEYGPRFGSEAELRAWLRKNLGHLDGDQRPLVFRHPTIGEFVMPGGEYFVEKTLQ